MTPKPRPKYWIEIKRGSYETTINRRAPGKITKRVLWWSKAVARNGQIMYTSETYKTHASCMKTARILAKATGWEIRDLAKGKK